MNISRKDFIASGTKYAAGAVIGAVAADTLMNKAMAGVNAAWPFPYQALDVEKVRILGHDLYYDATYGGCCYGAFAALVNASAAITGEPFTSFPSGLMLWGGGGGASWGGTCGAVAGSAAFITLVTAKADYSALESEVFGWYTQTKFPTDISNQYGVQSKYIQNKYTQALAQNISGSILCHASIAEWCKTAKLAEYPSRFSVGASGKIKGRDFGVLGRVRSQYDQGFWDEWFVQFADQKVGWVVEDEGDLTLVFKNKLTVPIPPYDQIRVGEFFPLGDDRVFVSGKGSGTVKGAEGQVSMVFPPGHQVHFVLGNAANKAVRLFIDADSIIFQTGEPLEFNDVVVNT